MKPQCDRIMEWLDEGLPPAGDEAARRHAAKCSACARAIAAGRAVERALAAAPPVPPRGGDAFVASVLERIQAVAAPARVRPESPRGNLWWGLLSEPAFVVGSIALVLIALVPAISRQEAGRSLAIGCTFAFQALVAAAENLVVTAAGPFLRLTTFDPYARATALACFLGLFVWGGYWATGAIDRWLRSGSGRRV